MAVVASALGGLMSDPQQTPPPLQRTISYSRTPKQYPVAVCHGVHAHVNPASMHSPKRLPVGHVGDDQPKQLH